MVQTKKCRIDGMTCTNCEMRIGKTLRAMKGVIKANVFFKTASAEITFEDKKTTWGKILAAIEGLGYSVESAEGISPKRIWKNVGMLACIVALYLLMDYTGVLNLLVPSQLADGSMGYGMLFAIGLITSVHCIAMCGGINLSQCLPKEGEPNRLGAVWYNLGRVVSYTLVGFILGLVGMFLGGGAGGGLSTTFQGIIKIIAGVFMVIMGINMLNLVPGLRGFGIHMPKGFVKKVGAERAKATQPFVIGLLNGLMPCGPLQSMQLVALASGSPVTGALSMLMFSLGTVPLMLGFGSLVSALGQRFTRVVTKVGAVLVTVMGLSMFSQGGILSGLLTPFALKVLLFIGVIACILSELPYRKQIVKKALLGTTAIVAVALIGMNMGKSTALAEVDPSTASGSVLENGVQVVESELTASTYPNIVVKAGTPVRWNLKAPAGTINGCNNRIVIPSLGKEVSLKEGDNIIEFTPQSAGVIQYTCWMGMIRAQILVQDENGNLPASADGTASGTDAYSSVYTGTTRSGCCGGMSRLYSSSTDTGSSYGYGSYGYNNYSYGSQTSSSALNADGTVNTDGAVTAIDGNGVQVVNSQLTASSYPTILVKAGTPVRWVLNVPQGSLNGCNYRILCSQLGLDMVLKEGDNLIEFTPTEAGVIQYTCWMGMIRARILIADETGTVPAVGDYDISASSGGCCGNGSIERTGTTGAGCCGGGLGQN